MGLEKKLPLRHETFDHDNLSIFLLLMRWISSENRLLDGLSSVLLSVHLAFGENRHVEMHPQTEITAVVYPCC